MLTVQYEGLSPDVWSPACLSDSRAPIKRRSYDAAQGAMSPSTSRVEFDECELTTENPDRNSGKGALILIAIWRRVFWVVSPAGGIVSVEGFHD